MSNQGRHRNSTDSTYMICFNNLEYIPYHDTHREITNYIIPVLISKKHFYYGNLMSKFEYNTTWGLSSN